MSTAGIRHFKNSVFRLHSYEVVLGDLLSLQTTGRVFGFPQPVRGISRGSAEEGATDAVSTGLFGTLRNADSPNSARTAA